MNINRRQFIAATAQTALALAPMATASESEAPAQMPIVDTHQHLWDLGKLRLPWLKSDEQLNRSYVTEHYLQAVEGLGVAKTVYMEVAVDVGQQLAEAQHVVELCRRTDNPTVAAVIGGRPGADDFPQYINRFKDSPYVKGVRQIIHRPESCREEPFVRGIRLLGELGMSFDLCMPAAQLAAGVDLVDRCPDTRFIIDHCGNADPKAFRPFSDRANAAKFGKPEHGPDQWRREIDRLAKRDNTVCKISGIVARAPKGSWTAGDLAPIVNHCLDAFGRDRVMFGGDWPVCTKAATLRQWITALKDVIRDRSQTERRQLLHDNAVRFYGLK